MKLKKIFTGVFLLAFALCATLAFVSCGDEPEEECTAHTDTDGDYKCDSCQTVLCTVHKDEDADKLCDMCGSEFYPKCSSHVNENGNGKCDVCGKAVLINVNVFVADQYGNGLEGITVYLEDEDYELYTVTTDADGYAEVSLYTGVYQATYETTTIPSGYLAPADRLTVESVNQTLALTVTNNIPNGEASRPYIINAETETLAIPAGVKYYYIIYHASGRNIDFTGEGFEIVYNDKTYTPESGAVSYTLEETDTNVQTFFTIENTTDEEITIGVSLYADPGAQGNPFVIDSLGSITASGLDSGNSVYYVWTATSTSTLVISLNPTYFIKTPLLSTAMALTKNSGNDDTFEGEYTLIADEVAYTLTVGADTIIVTDTSDSASKSTYIGGEYTYTVGENGISIFDSNSKTAPFSISIGGKTVIVTNNTNSKQVRVGIDGIAATIDVALNDTVSIVVSSSVSDTLTFNLAFEENADENEEQGGQQNGIQTPMEDVEIQSAIGEEKKTVDIIENADKAYTITILANSSVSVKLEELLEASNVTVSYDSVDVLLTVGGAMEGRAAFAGVPFEVAANDGDFYVTFENMSDKDATFDFTVTFS